MVAFDGPIRGGRKLFPDCFPSVESVRVPINTDNTRIDEEARMFGSVRDLRADESLRSGIRREPGALCRSVLPVFTIEIA